MQLVDIFLFWVDVTFRFGYTLLCLIVAEFFPVLISCISIVSALHQHCILIELEARETVRFICYIISVPM